MNTTPLKKDPAFYFLSLILILATVLRFYHLTWQSLWVDELHTMIEADPAVTYQWLFEYLKCCDTQPPLYYLMEKILFSQFGYTEGVARSLSAACGILSVGTMYLLGKELMDKKLGLIAALLTSVNYFSIEYSQEVRSYAMAMLLSILSFLYFIRLIKDPRYRHIFGYVIFTLLLLYTHYYSLFIVTAQGLTAFIFLFGDSANHLRYFRVFGISGLLIALGYAPWLPFLLAKSEIQAIWISKPPPDFAIGYFFDYFGNYPLLDKFLVLLMVFFLWQLWKQKGWSLQKIRESPIQLTFVVFIIAITATYAIPYARSLMAVPILFNRYTIVVLPGFILFIALAFVMISNRWILAVLLSGFVMITLWNHIFVTRYYRTIRKTQFREMTQFISQHPNRSYPIVEEVTDWQHAYYLKQYHVDAPVLSGNKKANVDSILRRTSAKYDLEGFWIVGAHGSPFLDSATRSSLDTAYRLVSQQDYYDAWSQLFEKYKTKEEQGRLRDVTKYFSNERIMLWWNGAVESRPIPIMPGRYRVIFMVRGTLAGNEFSHINLYVDNRKVADFFTTAEYTEKTFSFETTKEENIILKLDFDNDVVIDGDDRNVYVQMVRLEKLN